MSAELDPFDDASAGGPAPPSAGADAGASPLLVLLPRGCRAKRDLLSEYSRQLRLPDYFGWNWDALEECLRDLSWLEPGQAVLIRHAGLPLTGRSRRIYLEALAEAARHWRESKQRRFQATFPRSLEAKIRRILRSGDDAR